MAVDCDPPCAPNVAKDLPTGPPVGGSSGGGGPITVTVVPPVLFLADRDTCSGKVSSLVSQRVEAIIPPGTTVFTRRCPGDIEFDHSILCDATGTKVIVSVTYSTTGVPTATFAFLNGAPYTGDPLALVDCGGSALESDALDWCADGADVTQWIVKDGGQPNGTVYWTNAQGLVIPAPAPAELVRGSCRSLSAPRPEYDHSLMCDQNGVPVVVVMTYDLAATTGGVPTVTYYTLDGALYGGVVENLSLNCPLVSNESDAIYWCDNGVSVTQWIIKSSGQPTGTSFWTNAQGLPIPAPTAGPDLVRGQCAKPYFTEVFGCLTDFTVDVPPINVVIQYAHNADGTINGFAVFDADGALITTDPSQQLTLGLCQIPNQAEIDLVVTNEYGCADNNPFTRRTTQTVDNTAGGVIDTVVQYVNSLGVVSLAAPSNFLLGPCPVAEIDHTVTMELGCASGVPFTRRTQTTHVDLTGQVITAVDYVNSAGVSVLVSPVGFALGACPQADNEFHILCDVGPSSFNRFLRRYVVSATGVVTTVDTTLNGVTPYVIVGQVVVCDPDPQGVVGGGAQIAGGVRSATPAFTGAGSSWNSGSVGGGSGRLQSVTVTARSVTDGVFGQTPNQITVGGPDGTTIALMDGESRTWSVVRRQDANFLPSFNIIASGNAYANITYTYV